jgi:hypothetical protein
VTTRPSGAPHVVPTDGIWHDENFYFGGHPATVHLRNLEQNQRVAVHGWGSSIVSYRAGVWRVAPRRVLTWQELPRDSTRFTF